MNPTIEQIRRLPKLISSRSNGHYMTGYQMFLFKDRWYYTHQHVVNREPHICSLCNKKLPRKTHSIVHHKDGTRLNNNPANLQLVTRREHAAIHGKWNVISADKPKKMRRAGTGTRRTPRPAFLERRITWG
jgi:HNH endonuclease